MTKYYLWLLQLLRPANPEIHRVLDYYGDPETAYNEISGGDISALSAEAAHRRKSISLDKSEKIEEYCCKNNVSIMTISDEAYPVLLSETYNPPAVFFYRGDLSCLDKLSITIVGAREVVPYIAKLCNRVSRDLAAADITLVSGMARGVDSIVHNACVRSGKPTVGVLACGIDYDYPKGSLELREQMIMNGGAYITELFPGTSPCPEYFRARNRILAGLSSGTAVFQASSNSGSLITANYAVEENRDVFCVPPPDVFNPRFSGVVGLLRDGAVILFNHDDIINLYRHYND